MLALLNQSQTEILHSDRCLILRLSPSESDCRCWLFGSKKVQGAAAKSARWSLDYSSETGLSVQPPNSTCKVQTAQKKE